MLGRAAAATTCKPRRGRAGRARRLPARGGAWPGLAGGYKAGMATEHLQVRIISLLEEAANSFEQLETLANRTLAQIPAAHIDQVELRSLERDYVNDENEPGSEMDHVVFIRYRTTTVEDTPEK
jgi:hypothetical protein